MERRSHWTDELIDAVQNVINDYYYNGPSDDDPYDVIAAVEDNLAIIQKVRNAVDSFVPIRCGHPQADQATRIQALKDADAVLRALGDK